MEKMKRWYYDYYRKTMEKRFRISTLRMETPVHLEVTSSWSVGVDLHNDKKMTREYTCSKILDMHTTFSPKIVDKELFLVGILGTQHSWKIRKGNGGTRCLDMIGMAEAMAPTSVDQRSGTLLWEAAIDLGRFISRHLCAAINSHLVRRILQILMVYVWLFVQIV